MPVYNSAQGEETMPTPLEQAREYLEKLEADRRNALEVSEQKAEEAKLIKARQEGFQAAIEILGIQLLLTVREHATRRHQPDHNGCVGPYPK